jgi:hypothetical protein
MHAHKKARAFYAFASLLLLSSAAEARRVDARFFLDGAAGVSVPLADRYWRDSYSSVSPRLSLRLGVELWLDRRFALAPEVAVDATVPHITSATEARVRGLVGLRALVGFGRGHAFFWRFLVGVDGVGSDVALGLEPGVGMQFRFARHGVAGFAIDFPIGFHRLFAPSDALQVDLSLMGFIGLRV